MEARGGWDSHRTNTTDRPIITAVPTIRSTACWVEARTIVRDAPRVVCKQISGCVMAEDDCSVLLLFLFLAFSVCLLWPSRQGDDRGLSPSSKLRKSNERSRTTCD